MSGESRKGGPAVRSVTSVISAGAPIRSGGPQEPVPQLTWTQVAPARVTSLMMGTWFVSSFFGNYLSGWLGTLYGQMARERFFLLLSALGLAAAGAILAFARPLRRALAGEG